MSEIKKFEDGTEGELMATVQVYRIVGSVTPEQTGFRSEYEATDEAVEGTASDAAKTSLQIAEALKRIAHDAAGRAMFALMMCSMMGERAAKPKKDGVPSKDEIEEALKAMERSSK